MKTETEPAEGFCRGQKKRVCVIRHNYLALDPRVSKEVEALSEKGYSIDVICLRLPGEKGLERLNENVSVYRIPVQHKRKGIFFYLLEYGTAFVLYSVVASWLYLKKHYQVIQVNNMPDVLVFTTLLPKLGGAKVVFDIHDAVPELVMTKFGNNGRGGLLRRMAVLAEKLAVRYADHVFVTSLPFLRVHQQRGLRGEKATVLLNSPSERIFSGTQETVPVPKGGDEKFRIVYHGSVHERYGIHVLIEAMKVLKGRIPFILDIYSMAECSEETRGMIERLGLKEEVVFHQRIPLQMVPVKLREADLGVIPLVNDIFIDKTAPNKIFELAACGVPIVATRTTGMSCYFDDSCVLYFESGNAQDLAGKILVLYHDEGKRRQLAAHAWEQYDKYRWNRIKLEYTNVFERVGAR